MPIFIVPIQRHTAVKGSGGVECDGVKGFDGVAKVSEIGDILVENTDIFVYPGEGKVSRCVVVKAGG